LARTRIAAFGLAATLAAAPAASVAGGAAAPKDAELPAASVGHIQAIGAAVQAYIAAKGSPPVVAGGPVTIEFLRPLIGPFLAQPPLHDPWGHPYLYWSDGRDYLVVGTGKDGEDRSYAQLLGGRIPAALERICLGAREFPEADIVFTRGLLCQWPRGFVAP